MRVLDVMRRLEAVAEQNEDWVDVRFHERDRKNALGVEVVEEGALGGAGGHQDLVHPNGAAKPVRSASFSATSRFRARVGARPSRGMGPLYEAVQSDRKPTEQSALEVAALSWVTDGGLETDLLFHRGIVLPQFAAFPLVEDERAQVLRDY